MTRVKADCPPVLPHVLIGTGVCRRCGDSRILRDYVEVHGDPPNSHAAFPRNSP
jgi:hypothetical protein